MKGVSLSHKTEQERLRLLYAPMLANQVIGSTVVAVVLLMLFGQHASWWVLFSWGLLAFGVVTYHVWLMRAFDAVKSHDFSAPQWAHKHLLGVALSGALWGAAVILFAMGASSVQLKFLALVTTGVAVVAIKLLSPSPKGMVIYAILGVLPLLAMVVIKAEWLGIPLLSYLGIQMYVSHSKGIQFKNDYYTAQSMAYASQAT